MSEGMDFAVRQRHSQKKNEKKILHANTGLQLVKKSMGKQYYFHNFVFLPSSPF